MARRERVLGPQHPDTVWARGNLANSCRRAGRTADAVRHARQAYEDALAVLGAEHSGSHRSAVDLAAALLTDGRPDEAAELAGPVWSAALAAAPRGTRPPWRRAPC
ncbi:tetratricopeptide repeat protein [Kitasatospora gansuensis]